MPIRHEEIKIHRETERRKSYYERLKEKGQKTTERILESVVVSEPDGKSAQQLEEEIGCHRDTRRRHCNRLIKNGLLEQKGGKRGKYHLGPKAIEDPGLAAFIFQEKAMKQFNVLGGKQVCVSSRFCNDELCNHIVSKLMEEKVVAGKDLDELFLFEYALKTGAIITYEIIQSIRYTLKITNLSSTKKDELIMEWLENVTGPMALIQSFRKSPPVLTRLKIETGNAHQDAKLSWLELKKGEFKELENIFKSTFPDLFEDLEKIRKNLQGDINVHRYKHLNQKGLSVTQGRS